jgi:hypothetical protein
MAFATAMQLVKRGIFARKGLTDIKSKMLDKLVKSGFIVKQTIRFSKPIDPKRFEGTLTLKKIIPRGEKDSEGNYKYYFLDCDFSFDNGSSKGNILFALVLT